MVTMNIQEIILADLQDGMKVSEISRVMRIYEQTGSLRISEPPGNPV